MFKQVYIPRTLTDVTKYEGDADMLLKGEGHDIAYSTVTGMKPDLSGPALQPASLNPSNAKQPNICITSNSSEESEESDCSSVASEGSSTVTKVERKTHKKEVKKANRERREHKIPKHVKKRKDKVAKQKNKQKR